MSDSYGLCPKCGAEGIKRNRCSPHHPDSCTDKCAKGHTYLSKEAVYSEIAAVDRKDSIQSMFKKHPEIARGKKDLAWHLKNKGNEPMKKKKFTEWLEQRKLLAEYGPGKPCNCGSGLQKEPIYDAKGIFVTYACDKCKVQKLKGFRKDIFDNPNYKTDEPVDEE